MKHLDLDFNKCYVRVSVGVCWIDAKMYDLSYFRSI
jgi:hypothetical protein